jgi:hypothetical protein
MYDYPSHPRLARTGFPTSRQEDGNDDDPEVLPGKDTAKAGELYISFELADKKWKVTASDGCRSPSRYNVDAGHTTAVADCIRKAAERCKFKPSFKAHSCYEAGRDGWWLHRWLVQQGVDNIVVDSASIEVNRRARRAKTERLDGDKLLAMLLRHHGGERVWSVLREPTPEDEDARRTHRELARLTSERTAHMNRIGSLLVLHNLRPNVIVGGRDWAAWWERHREQVPPVLRAEVERESARLSLVKQQVKALEAERRLEVEAGKQPLGGTPDSAAGNRSQDSLGAGQGALRLAALCQPARTRRQSGSGTHAVRQWRQPDGARHQQGRQQASAGVAGGTGMGLAAPAARQRVDAVVEPALRRQRRAHATRGHRGAGPAPGHRAMAPPRAR